MLGSTGQLFAGKEAPEKVSQVTEGAKTIAKTVPKELAGGGPTMDRLLAAKDMNALKVKNDILKPLEKTVHDDAKKTIQSAVTRMDEHVPGAASKSQLATDIDKKFGELVKIPEKLPTQIQKMLSEKGSTPTVRALSERELRAATMASDFLKEGMPLHDVKSAMQQLGFPPRQVDAIISVASPQADTGFWSPSQLQQLRSDLGKEIFGSGSDALPGPVRVASIETYKMLTDKLNETANKANAKLAWDVGNEKWRLYNQTFDGVWEGGRFQETPLAKALRGQTADDIIGALNEGKTQWTKDLLGRYRQFSGGIPKIIDAINKHNRLEFLRKSSVPSKYEAFAALAAPVYPHTVEALAALRFLSPPVLRWLATRGINPENVRGFSEVTPGVPRGSP